MKGKIDGRFQVQGEAGNQASPHFSLFRKISKYGFFGG
jgi:hypothetical protein